MRGVHSRPVLERVPPSTDGLRRLLGTVDRDGKAVGGMEAALDGALRGTPSGRGSRARRERRTALVAGGEAAGRRPPVGARGARAP